MRRLNVLRNLSVSGKLTALGAVAVVALMGFAAVALSTLASVRIGSERYQLISDNNALLADVLPPPEYLVESYLVAHMLMDAGRQQDTAEVDRLAAYARTLRTQFDERLAFWVDNTTIDPAVRTLITQTSAQPAQRFLAQLETEFVPALRRGDLTAADTLLQDPMAAAYDEHRAAVDEIVTMTVAEASRLETSSRATAAGRQTFLLGLLAATLVALVTLAVAIARGISRPLHTLERRLGEIADGGGDLTTRLAVDREDELGRVARSFNRFVEQLGDTMRHLRGNADQLLDEAHTMAATSRDVAGACAETEAQTTDLAESATAVAHSINTVVLATEEMQNAIAEIARSASEAVGVAGSAMAAADRADAIMGSLGDSSAEITGVVGAITNIAEQTNLLALNATIEAARAGEAGKGFAVVANEVKDLARATAEATGSITQRINAMQDAAGNAVTALHDIRGIIARISDAQNIIAAAVEEQTATTREIEASVRQAADSAESISGGIHRTAERTRSIAEGVGTTAAGADTVAATAEELRVLVGQFRT